MKENGLIITEEKSHFPTDVMLMTRLICEFKNKNDAKLFFDYLNSRHNNIRFFPIDILIEKSPSTFSTSVYHNKTYTGLLTNYVVLLTSTLQRNSFPQHLIERII